jgi:hypothetical protein
VQPNLPCKQAIVDLVARYALQIDAHDVSGLLDCMAEDVSLAYEDGTIRIEGREEAREFFERALAGLSTHLLANVLVESAGIGFIARGSGIAVVSRHAGVMTVRGLLYTFRCVPSGPAVLIRHLEHRTLWVFDAPAVTR